MSPALACLAPFREAGLFEPIDWQFAQAMARMVNEDSHEIVLAAALASRAPRAGHVHAALATIAASIRLEPSMQGDTVDLPWPETADWLQTLAKSALVGDGSTATPMVLEGDRLYLSRYWSYQEQLAHALQNRAARVIAIPEGTTRDQLWRLFPEGDKEPNRQRLAALVAVLRGLAIITGGPGTGKTTTVVRLLALLLQLSDHPLRIALAAPTGKAAARMAEAIRQNKAKLDVAPHSLDAIPTEAVTIHRLLGYQYHQPTRFRHHAGNPLPYDVVIVDEASMVSLAQMAKLIDAVAPDARLILLGDRDQLASVEAGSVLSDLCAPSAGDPGFSPAFAERLRAYLPDVPVSGSGEALRDCLVHLNVSHRFQAASGIGQLALAVNQQDAARAFAVLRGETTAELALFDSSEPGQRQETLRQLVLSHYPAVTPETTPHEALQALNAFFVLCAHRQGPMGVEGLNKIIQNWLSDVGKLQPDGEWFVGRPVMVTKNDHRQGLYNGDIGITLADPADPTRLRVYFPSPEGHRSLTPSRMPPHETVFAMTVHKSQGSEFERVVLVLPDRESAILTKELLYTGITRAKRHVTLIGPEAVITTGIQAKVQRASGLQERLWGDT